MTFEKLSTFELGTYLFVWIGTIGYSIYQTFKAGDVYFSTNLYDTFTDGSLYSHRKKDDSDYEWKFGLALLVNLIPWFILHFIGAEILKKFEKGVILPIWYSFVGLSFSITQLGLKPTLYFVFQPTVGYILVQPGRKFIIWMYNLFSLLVLNYYEYFNVNFSNYSDFEIHIVISTLAWINLRCLNYFLEVIEDKTKREFTFKNVLNACAYCLYLPLMFFGPLVLYTNFRLVFEQSEQRDLVERIRKLIFRILRFLFWLFFTEFALHFVYVNAMSYETELIKNMNYWALYGLGYCMGQMFHLKYVVFYGISTNLAKFDNIPVPNIPKCIGRIHLYSDMWKYFDHGLYLFLLRYIYIPACRNKRTLTMKIFGSFLCFLYVYIWHGIQTFIAIWAFMNFLGIVIEMLCSKISKLPATVKVLKELSPTTKRRITCALVSPLFAMSAFSNFYFFAGRDVGDIYINRFLEAPVPLMFVVFSVLYCGSNVSYEIKQWESAGKKQY